MHIVTTGLVLREVRVGDSDKLLTILTAGTGKITAKAQRVLQRNSRIGAGCQLFSYSNFTLFENNGRYTINESAPIELFYGLREDMQSMALAAYIAEMLEALSDADDGQDEMLRLGLNTLYALAARTAPCARIKAAAEFRAMVLSGYEPACSACAACGSEEIKNPVLEAEEGLLYCKGCLPAGQNAYMLDTGALAALRYTVGCDLKRLFAFSLTGSSMESFCAAAEGYLKTCLDKTFKTLEFYNSNFKD